LKFPPHSTTDNLIHRDVGLMQQKDDSRRDKGDDEEAMF
jgi:hypothetical protein